MHHFHFPPSIKSPAGFAISKAEAGQPGILLQKLRITSREKKFVDYVRQIHGIFIAKACLNPAVIHRSLILVHQDQSFDLYLNDFPEVDNVIVNRDMQAGEAIFAEDIADINSVDFPGIEILPEDKIIYQVRSAWEFGLYFDLSGHHGGSYKEEILQLKKELILTSPIEKAEEDLKKGEVLVVTEGKTDWRHMERAMENLKLGLPIKYFKDESIPAGYDDREKMCEMFARAEKPYKVVFVFDRDRDDLVKRLNAKTKLGEDFQDWGNNVYSLLIPVPTHRQNHKGIEIELLYTDIDLGRKDTNGKRLFFWNEIDRSETLPSGEKILTVKTPDPSSENSKKVFSGKAEEIALSDGTRLAISKARFAEYIHEQKPGFVDPDFASFAAIFHTIAFINAKN